MMKRRAFTAVETAAVAGVGAVGIGLLAPALNSARITSMRQADVMNLRVFGVAQGSYEMDNQDRIATYSWFRTPQGEINWTSEFDDLGPAGVFTNSVSEPMFWQSVDILRRLTGDDGSVFRPFDRFFPHRTHGHLVFLDYLGMDALEEFAVSPGDTRAAASREILRTTPDLGEGVDLAKLLFPSLADMGAVSADEPRQIMPYMSSYGVVPFAWSPDSGFGRTPAPAPSTHWLYSIPSFGTVLGERRASEVAFPAQKVFMFGHYDYASIPGQPIYYAFREAKGAQLFFDGSAGTNAIRDANFGINPRDGNYANFSYRWETDGAQDYRPPAGLSTLGEGDRGPIVNGYYQWTAGGLGGIDFGAKPLDPFNRDLDDPHGD